MLTAVVSAIQQKKKLKRYADANGLDNTLSLSAFLIAQLGKNYRDNIESPDGNSIISPVEIM